MPKKRQKLAALFCAAALVCALPLPSAAAVGVRADGDLVLVGLNYGSTALDGANLANQTGSGFRFGYLDSGRGFHQVGDTNETALSVVKTQNVWYGSVDGYTSYFDSVASDVFVGCWHVQLPAAPASYGEAQSAAAAAGGFPAWIDGAYQVRTGAYATQAEAQTAALAVGGLVVSASANGVSVVKTGTGTILFQFDGGAGKALTVKPGLDDGLKTTTLFKGSQYYGAFQYQRSGGDLTVSNLLSLGDYVNCVISREMSSSWPLEALKAQAVCARTYYDINLGKHTADGFDICSTTDCQAYYGMSETNARTEQAAAETAGMRAWYNGALAQTYYFSSDGGGTEDSQNVWTSNTVYPYLCGVIDPYEASVADKNSNSSWSVTITAAEITSKLQALGYACGAITGIQTELSPTGNVKTITYMDANGKSWPFTNKKNGPRTFLGLKSIRFTVSGTGTGTGGGAYYTDGGNTLSSVAGAYAVGGDGSVGQLPANSYAITGSGVSTLANGSGGGGAAAGSAFTFTGSGWGHSVGMSQWGAYAMASQGKTYGEILKFYFPGVEIR